MNIRIVCGIVFLLTFKLALSDGSSLTNGDANNDAGGIIEESGTDSSRNFQFYASDKAAQFRYERNSSVVSVDNGRVNVGFLFDEERDNLFFGGLVVDSTPEFLPGVRFAFGGKVYAALLGVENSDVFGVGMGIEAAYDLPVKQFPLHLEASVYYAPDILSFGQADRIIDWQVKAGLRLRKTVIGYVGFRYLEFDTRPGDIKPDNAVHIGVRWDI